MSRPPSPADARFDDGQDPFADDPPPAAPPPDGGAASPGAASPGAASPGAASPTEDAIPYGHTGGMPLPRTTVPRGPADGIDIAPPQNLADATPPHRDSADRVGRATAPIAPPAYADALPPDLAELRTLLLGPQQAAVLDRLAVAGPDGLDAAELSDLLPAAVRLRQGRDDALGAALAPTIETGLRTSVERDPQPVVDAIFPVIGPAIRRAIRHALGSSAQSVNLALNYGLSWRGLRWRMEAWRTGRSFGEVVLLHTLRYRVEQVLLVHRESGLLLHHAVADGMTEAGDGDLVSGMLTAIRQFAADSFHVDESEALDTLEVGDLTVWIEPGPRAVLAAVVRGHPPAELRETMRRTIETIHARYGASLGAFTGNTAPFDGAEALLEDCLDEQFTETAPERLGWKGWLLIALALGALGWWAWTAWQRDARDDAYVRRLQAEPGIEVLSAERHRGHLHPTILRDPDARLPRPRAADGFAPGDVLVRQIPYTSDEPEIAAARVAGLAGRPAGITFTAAAADGRTVVRAAGWPADADTSWTARVRQALPFTPGVDALDTSGLVSLDSLAASLESRTMQFDDSAALETDGLEALRSDLAALAGGAARSGVPLAIRIVGHTDGVGTEAANDVLGMRRARAARAVLRDAAGGVRLDTVSRGAAERLGEGAHPPSRRVTFEVIRE